MKRGWLFLIGCLLVPVYAGALVFVPGEMAQSTNKTLRRILPRLDKQEEPTAVLFIKTDILNVSVRGHVIGVPRRVNDGYVLFVPQGVSELQLNAPLYQTQTIHFKPVASGQYYEMTLAAQPHKAVLKEAARQAKELDLTHTQVNVGLDFDYMELPEEIRQNRGALIYLDKTLDFAQWQQLLKPNGAYLPFDMGGNKKNPCCLVVAADTPIENVFNLRRVVMDDYIETVEGGNTYHTTLTLTPKK